MNDFDLYLPTKVYFGRQKIKELSQVIASFGKRVLLVYGGASIQKNGILTQVIEQLNGNEIFELSGIQPNPRIEKVREGQQICKLEKIEVVLAVGGGSVMDSAKAIAASAFYEGDPWDFTRGMEQVTRALPLVVVPTLSATGSEGNGTGVLSDWENHRKQGFRSDLVRPYAAILDPGYTFSVPPFQTAAGSADILSHLLENYFDQTPGTAFQDHLAEGMMQTVLENTQRALQEPADYDARANLMWSAFWALNGLTGAGRGVAWSAHAIEHELSAYYDVTHGAGLAILTPRWMMHVLNDETKHDFARFAKEVWKLSGSDELLLAKQGIQALYQVFETWGLPLTLPEIGIDAENLEKMAQAAYEHKLKNAATYQPLSAKDIFTILEQCMQPMEFSFE